MFNPEKFKYLTLPKVSTEEGRRYLSPNGERLPSVTTILDATKSEESKHALQNWRRTVGVKRAQEITTEAANRGTRMHKWLENYVKNGDPGLPGSNPNSKQSHQMASIIIEQGLSKCTEFYGTEVSLFFPEIYAGSTDLIGLHDNSIAIMDHKQTNKPKKKEWIEDYFTQLCAYANAHNEVYNTNISKGVIFMCSKDFEYQEFIIEGQEFKHYSDKWWKRVEQYYSRFV